MNFLEMPPCQYIAARVAFCSDWYTDCNCIDRNDKIKTIKYRRF